MDMTKIKLNNTQDFITLLNELKEDEDTAVSFHNEETPKSLPCIAIHFYAYDVDYGSAYTIEFVYPSDFN